MSQKTPQSSYTGPIVVDPLTRVEGHLRIEVEVENGKVSNARSVGTLFRGLETILKNRDPRDVQHFTQRICGVCTYVHGLASTRALENACYNADNSFHIPANATYIRNLVLGMQQIHDHVVHFYHLHAGAHAYALDQIHGGDDRAVQAPALLEVLQGGTGALSPQPNGFGGALALLYPLDIHGVIF